MMNSCLKDNGWKETVCFVVSFISRWSISRTGHEADARYCLHGMTEGEETSSKGETIPLLGNYSATRRGQQSGMKN